MSNDDDNNNDDNNRDHDGDCDGGDDEDINIVGYYYVWTALFNKYTYATTPHAVYHALKSLMGPCIKARSRSLQSWSMSSVLLPICTDPQDLSIKYTIHCQNMLLFQTVQHSTE